MNNKDLLGSSTNAELYFNKSSSAILTKFKVHMFNVLLFIFDSSIPNDPPSFFLKLSFFLNNLSISLQVSSFLWRSDSQIAYWGKYEFFWQVISFTRIDLLCAYLNLNSAALILVNCALLLVIFLFLLCHLLLFNEKKPVFLIKFLLSKLIKGFSNIFFVPTLAILCIDLKYYFSSTSTMKEYNIPNRSYNNSINFYRSFFSGLILILINFIYEFFSFEIRHTARDKVICARSTAQVDAIAKILYAAVIVLYMFVYDFHPELYNTIAFLIYTFISLQYLYHLPYYFDLANRLKVIISSAEAFVALSFLLGYAVDDASVILVCTIFVVPSACFIVDYFFKYRKELVGKIDPIECSCEQLELLLRESLSSRQPDLDILNKFDKKFKILENRTNGLACIWQTYYCIDVVKDIRLSFVKLSRAFKLNYSIILDFQIFKCSKLLNSLSLDELEDLTFLRYSFSFEKLKKRDLDLSFCLLKFWGELITTGDIVKLNKLADEAANGLAEIKKKYEELLMNYPATSKFKEFFKSFLIEIYQDSSGLNDFMMRLMSNKENAENSLISYFDDKNGVILVSGNKHNIGEITYANSKFSEILGQSISTIIGSNISTFIPGTYGSYHNEVLCNFIENCKNTQVPFIGSLFLQTETGYLIEVVIRSRLTAINEDIFFLAVIKKVNFKRHIVSVSSTGLIYSYDSKLPHFLGMQNIKLNMVEDIFPFSIEDLETHKMYSINFKGKRVGVVKSSRMVSSITMFILLIYENIEYMKKIECLKDSEKAEKVVVRIESLNETNRTQNFKVGFCDDNNAGGTATIASQMMQETALMEKVERSSQSFAALSASEKYSRKVLSEAIRGIVAYKWILLSFVLIAIAASIAILARISVDVATENEPNLTIFLGTTADSLAAVAFSSRLIELKARNSMNYSFYSNIFNENTQKILNLMTNLASYKDSYWTGCSVANFINKPSVPVISLANQELYTHLTLYDFLDQFTKNAFAFINNMQTGENYQTELFFVLFNGGSTSADFIKDRAEESVRCATDRSKSIYSTKIIILYLGLIALGLSIAYVTFFVISLSKKINQLWTLLSKLSSSSYMIIKGTYTNRLWIIGDIDEQEISEHLVKDSGIQIKFRISLFQIWRYIWRLLIFSVFSISFYLLITLLYCSELEQSITSRAELIADLASKNYYVYMLNFYVVDEYCQGSELSLSRYYPKAQLKPSQLWMGIIIGQYLTVKNNIKDPKYLNYIPSDIYSLIFESVKNDTLGYNFYGLYSGLDCYFYSIIWISSNSFNSYKDDYSLIANEIVTLQENMMLILDDQLKSSINSTYQVIMIATILFSIFLLLLYIFLYIPYLNREIQHLKRIQSLSHLVSQDK